MSVTIQRMRTANQTSDGLYIVWGVLVGATTLSFAIGATSTTANSSLAAVVVTVAFGKAWLIAEYFMELRRAPRALRLIIGAYMVGVWAMLVFGFYL